MGTFHVVKAKDLQVGDVLALPFEQYVEVKHIAKNRNGVTVRSTKPGFSPWKMDLDDEVSVQNTTKHHIVGMQDGELRFRACETCGEEDVSEDELCPEGRV